MRSETDITVPFVSMTQSRSLRDEGFESFDRKWTNVPLGECFSVRSRRYPERVALRLPEGDMSYAELDRRSDRVAAWLMSLSDSDRVPVVLMFEHESAAPVAVIGALKAGRPFVPLDVSYPPERNRFILADTGATVCLTGASSYDRVRSVLDFNHVFTIEEILPSVQKKVEPVRATADDVAQIIYTSGSSGKPKGVVRVHRMLLHNAMRHTNARRIVAEDRIALLFSYSFGAAMSTVFSALLNGATLLPFNLRDRGVGELVDWLSENQITQFHTVPTAFRRLAERIRDKSRLGALRAVQLGGESMYGRDLELFKRHFPSTCVLGVGMGTSETGHLLQCFFDTESEYDAERLPAGYPAEDCDVYLLDEEGSVPPEGEIGEIVVRGTVFASGYWRQPELTERLFSPAPEDEGGVVYRTGDLGYATPEGCIVHLGRKDQRVKVRGYRVEAGEVEAGLRKASGVRDAAVVVASGLDGENRLHGFLVLENDASTSGRDLRRELRSVLPDYMLPSRLVFLDALPTLPNGKVNRQALLDRSSSAVDDPLPAAGEREDAPRYLLEAQLCALWEELLEVDEVGIHDDFYDLGGDSLHAFDMFAAVEELTGRRLAPAGFMTGLTVARLCEGIINKDREYFSQPIVAVDESGSGPPFFFHSGDLETGGLYTRNMARHLNLDRPFFAILAHGIDGRAIPSTIQEMAAERLEKLLEIQPRGPYQLGGFCFGGLVAYEMAKQLRLRGEDVETLVLIDTKPRYRNNHVGRFFRICWSLFPSREIRWYRRLRRPFVYAKKLRVVGAKQAGKALMRRGDQVRSYLSLDQGNQNGRPRVLGDGYLFQLMHLSVRKYEPAGFDGRVVLLHSSRLDDKVGDDAAGWRDIADVEVWRVPGDHRSCVTKHVAELADRMRPYLTND